MGADHVGAVAPGQTSGPVFDHYRHTSRQNSVLLTERCDNYCVMCSQPPKTHDDSRLLQQAFQLLDLLPADTTDIICTGGEPTWYGDAFIDLLTRTYERLPVSGVHILSNGRRFSDGDYAARYAQGFVQSRVIMV
jgi:molybdenum cofactor biosynthesis enzyme MoaA